jgi:hypothetical protein
VNRTEQNRIFIGLKSIYKGLLPKQHIINTKQKNCEIDLKALISYLLLKALISYLLLKALISYLLLKALISYSLLRALISYLLLKALISYLLLKALISYLLLKALENDPHTIHVYIKSFINTVNKLSKKNLL